MEWGKDPEERDRDCRRQLEVGPAPDAPGKPNPMEYQPQENRNEKVPNGSESVLVHSLTPRVHHAVPITLPRATESEEKEDQEEEEEEETDLDILMYGIDSGDSDIVKKQFNGITML